uniref:Nucleotide-binding oligomerization domain containing 1 n=1 Tax=Sinocyclocheilus anshuiensis TaxID=1608454 RepID=A0A671MA66_9TELE
HVLHEAYDAYIDLPPWFEEIRYTPLVSYQWLTQTPVIVLVKYCEKLRYELGGDTQFITSYSKSEETPLEDLYTDTQMELLNDRGESLGYLQSLDELLGDQGVFNPQAETIFITFDEYDEIQTDFDLDNVPETVSPEEKTRPRLLLVNLLCGKLLKGSRKILTVRSGTEVQSRVIRKKVYLKGFSPENLKRYTALHFPEKEHKTMVTDQQDANPHLCGLCSIPLFSWIILKSFKHLHSVYDNLELPDSCITLTNVFLLLSEVFLGHSIARPGLLKRSTRCPAETFKAGEPKFSALARLALHGLEREGLVFNLQFGFLRPASHYDGCGGSATFEFLHEILQAFLAAFSLVLDSKITPESILSFFSKFHQFILMRPLVQTQRGTPGASRSSSFPLKEKHKMLKSYLSNSVKMHLKGLPRYPSTDIDGDKVHAMPNFLWMLRCIFEMNSEDVAKMTANGISADYIKIAFCNIYSVDCSALNFVLHHHRKQLRPSFSKNYGTLPFRFCVNQLTDCSIEVLAEELIRHKIIKVLGLYKNYITDVGAKLVAKIIEECPHLKVVKLGCNNITGVGGKYLANAIHKSSEESPNLSANGITSHSGRSLAKALKENTKNELTINGAKQMSEGLINNTTLKEVK